MPDAQELRGPSADEFLEGAGTVLDVGSVLLGGSELASGLTSVGSDASGLGGQATGGPDPIDFMGGISGLAGDLLGLPGVSAADDILGDVFGGMGNAFGIYSGVRDAVDSDNDTSERAVGGLGAVGNLLSLGGTLGGTGLSVSMLNTAASGVFTAGTASAMTSGGAVLGAGLAGYQLGSLIDDVGHSDHARQNILGQGENGEDRTMSEAIIDSMVNLNLGADAMGENANRAIDGAGAHAGGWMQDHLGFGGNSVSGAFDRAGNVASGVMDFGGGYVGAVGSVIGGGLGTIGDAGVAGYSWLRGS